MLLIDKLNRKPLKGLPIGIEDEQSELFSLIARLWKHISKKRRKQLSLVLVLSIASSFAEVVSIGAVLPFLGALTSPKFIFEHPVTEPFNKIFGISTADQLVFPLLIGFCLVTLLAASLRLLLLWSNTRLSYAIGNDINFEIFNRTLYQSYAVHINRSSSTVIDVLVSKTFTVVSSIVSPLLALISSSVVLVFVLAVLLKIDALIALGTFTLLGSAYMIVTRSTKLLSRRNGQKVAFHSTQLIKLIQEGLGGIRDILINGSQVFFSNAFQQAATPMYRALGSNVTITSSPRIAIESLGILFISLVAYGMSKNSTSLPMVVPVLGTIALGTQRLLPMFQQVYGAVASIRGGHASLVDTLKLLDQPMPIHANQPTLSPMPFNREIRLNNITFSYGAELPCVLRGLDLAISKGSRIGFIGTTGSGKSTLLDIIMGLLQPTSGSLEIDGQLITTKNNRAWQANIAHVPQSIYLADSSIEENIAFGVPVTLIDREMVRRAARQAQIAETIEALPEQYRTQIGESGIRLSGGQRQRIGIARALYKQAEVIVFDEATSALDNETEFEIINTMEEALMDKTILIVAHRLSTLKNADKIFEIGNTGVVRALRYEDIA